MAFKIVLISASVGNAILVYLIFESSPSYRHLHITAIELESNACTVLERHVSSWCNTAYIEGESPGDVRDI